MSSPFITVGSGGPNIPDGVYPVALTGITGPKRVTAQRGQNAGKEVDLLDWTFVVMGGEHEDTEIEATTSTASGPRSKLYSFLTALFGGQAPPVGTALEIADLTGRLALATIQRDDSGWPRIVSLGAMPQQMLSQQFARTAGLPAASATTASLAPVVPQQAVPAAPVAAAPAQPAAAPQQPAAPLREQVAQAAPGDLPF